MVYVLIKKYIHASVCMRRKEINQSDRTVQKTKRKFVHNFLANVKRDCSPKTFALGWTLTIFTSEVPVAFQCSKPSCHRI